MTPITSYNRFINFYKLDNRNFIKYFCITYLEFLNVNRTHLFNSASLFAPSTAAVTSTLAFLTIFWYVFANFDAVTDFVGNHTGDIFGIVKVPDIHLHILFHQFITGNTSTFAAFSADRFLTITLFAELWFTNSSTATDTQLFSIIPFPANWSL